MSIKERIGQRIKDERTSRGLTRKALAALTEKLSVSRINNYERGERTPGPEEIKQLAGALEVSASYLMCLSDSKEGALKKPVGLGALLPILSMSDATTPKETITKLKDENTSGKVNFVPVSAELSNQVGDFAFAMAIQDNSMQPEFRQNDLVIIDTERQAQPGSFVVAQMKGEEAVIIRKYKQLSASKGSQPFELIALNEDWANIHIEKSNACKILGVVVQLLREV